MSATSVTLRGQNAAIALMTDACTITRTSQVTNLQTGVVTNTTTTIYTGRCKVQKFGSASGAGTARPTSVGEAEVWQLPMSVHVPMTVTGVRVGDIVTASTSVLDPDLPGRSFWVRELFHKSYATARRLGLEEVTG
jgi:hypothetical protein